MKKIVSVFLALIFLITVSNAAFAAEKVVQLKIPGCASWGPSHRIGAILKEIKGIKQNKDGKYFQVKDHNLLIITYDDKETTLQTILDKLKKGKFVTTGEPVFLK